MEADLQHFLVVVVGFFVVLFVLFVYFVIEKMVLIEYGNGKLLKE